MAKMIATDRGYYNSRIIEAGQTFDAPDDMKGSWFKPVKGSNGAVSEDLSALSVPKLKEMAEYRGIQIPARATKTELIAILTGQAESSDDETDLA